MLLHLLIYFLITNIASGIKETTVDLIESQGYPAETHFVETRDGYILAIHRFETCYQSKKSVFLYIFHFCSISYRGSLRGYQIPL